MCYPRRENCWGFSSIVLIPPNYQNLKPQQGIKSKYHGRDRFRSAVRRSSYSLVAGCPTVASRCCAICSSEIEIRCRLNKSGTGTYSLDKNSQAITIRVFKHHCSLYLATWWTLSPHTKNVYHIIAKSATAVPYSNYEHLTRAIPSTHAIFPFAMPHSSTFTQNYYSTINSQIDPSMIFPLERSCTITIIVRESNTHMVEPAINSNSQMDANPVTPRRALWYFDTAYNSTPIPNRPY